jgi:hypothetical protein
MPRPRQEPEEKPWQVTARFPPDLAAKIKDLSSRRTVPPAILIRQLVKERLDQLEMDGAQKS